ncbi:MAG: hypothetical protein COA97_06685 [Flavobacteriales bacterium]|nr:MAG: hypothetical protein COA97_06685 [Flavobacteriales bacterium]
MISSIPNIDSKLMIQQKFAIIFSCIIIGILILFTRNNIYSIFGIGISIFIALRLLIMIGSTIPIIEIMLFIAAAQWIIGPIIDYRTVVTHYKMHMYVSELEYMRITTPLFFAFTLSSLNFTKLKAINIDELAKKINFYKSVPFYIIGIGLFFRIIDPFLPDTFKFINYLIINSSLVGLGLLYFTNITWKTKLLITFITFSPVFFHAINSGFFHVLIIWGLFIFIFINLAMKLSFFNKVLIILISIVFLFTLQTIKFTYRKSISDSSFKGDKLELFMGILFSDENVSKAKDDENINDVNKRLNQGWIISKIYDRIPNEKNFLEGETIIEAITSTLIPRFLMPSKSKSGGGGATFEKLTGFELLEGTTMGPSLMGEFYANFGRFGGVIAFLIWGRILYLIVNLFSSYRIRNPMLMLWLPIVFFQVIKAETDFGTILNHLLKSLIFIGIVIYFMKKVLNIKL